MGKPVILAVDDDASVLEAVVQDLRRKYGIAYRIMRAASGQAALDTCAQLKHRGDAVALFLSDHRMPGMSGVDFLEKAQSINASFIEPSSNEHAAHMPTLRKRTTYS